MDKTKLFGAVASRPVKGLPPGIRREKLTAPVMDSNGKIWPKGAEFVALAGGYHNPMQTTYRDVIFVSAPSKSKKSKSRR